MASNKEVRLEKAENGFIVRTEKRVERPKTGKPEETMYPSYDLENKEHVAATLDEAKAIIDGFLSAE